MSERIATSVDESTAKQFDSIVDAEHDGTRSKAVRALINQAVEYGTTQLSAGQGVTNSELLEELQDEIGSLRDDLDQPRPQVRSTSSNTSSTSSSSTSSDVDVTQGLLDEYNSEEPVPDSLRDDEDENVLRTDVLEQWAALLSENGDGAVPELNPRHIPENARDRPTGEEHQIALGIGVLKFEKGHAVQHGSILDAFDFSTMWGQQYMKSESVDEMIANELIELPDTHKKYALSDAAKSSAVSDAHKTLKSRLTTLRNVTDYEVVREAVSDAQAADAAYSELVEKTGLQPEGEADRDFDAEIKSAFESSEIACKEQLLDDLREMPSEAEEKLGELRALDTESEKSIDRRLSAVEKVQTETESMVADVTGEEHIWNYADSTDRDSDVVQNVLDAVEAVVEEAEDVAEDHRDELREQHRKEVESDAEEVRGVMKSIRDVSNIVGSHRNLNDERERVREHQRVVSKRMVDSPLDTGALLDEIDDLEAELESLCEQKKQEEKERKLKENTERVPELREDVMRLLDDLTVREDGEMVLVDDWTDTYHDLLDAEKELASALDNSYVDTTAVLGDIVPHGEEVLTLVRDADTMSGGTWDEFRAMSNLWMRYNSSEVKGTSLRGGV